MLWVTEIRKELHATPVSSKTPADTHKRGLIKDIVYTYAIMLCTRVFLFHLGKRQAATKQCRDLITCLFLKMDILVALRGNVMLQLVCHALPLAHKCRLQSGFSKCSGRTAQGNKCIRESDCISCSLGSAALCQ